MQAILEKYEKELKQEDIKLIELNTKDTEGEDYWLLKENLKSELTEQLEKIKQLTQKENTKLYYSLSYSQGDGVMFEGFFRYKNTTFKITQEGHYYHSKSHNIRIFNYKNKDYTELTEKQENEAEKEIDEFKENYYYPICNKLEKIGYQIIEDIDEENILKAGFKRFLEKNNIQSELELYDLEYKTQEEKGYIKIAEDGNTCIKGLWIKLPKLKCTRVLNIQEEIIKEVV